MGWWLFRGGWLVGLLVGLLVCWFVGWLVGGIKRQLFMKLVAKDSYLNLDCKVLSFVSSSTLPKVP